ncbi:MAG: 3-deoxy-D-manno-octulosonic acid transferase [Salinisphaera sp.]|nr:3-deoxy-D-manno-octulosonic acid transferase [Salinisphaera sp.]
MIWRAVYCLATWAALPLVLVYFAWRARREPAYAKHWSERLGVVARRTDRPLWVHAASVGEVILVAPLIHALQERWPDHAILLTTMTPTGRAEARRRFGSSLALGYVPLDTWGATRRFIALARPSVAIIAETELWPNLIAAASAANIPLTMVNATLSAESARRFARWPLASVARFMLSRFARIAAASEQHAERFVQLGALASHTKAVGNLKYDQPASRDLAEQASHLRADWQVGERPMWVAASTHAGEEAALLNTFRRLRQSTPNCLWVLAPRHPQRFDEVADLLGRSGYRIARRSVGDRVDRDIDIILADTLGEVPMFYAAADVVFVGGSLVTGIGGHNVIEAAVAGRVVATGPHVGEWQDIIDAMARVGAAAIANTPEALADQLSAWLADTAKRQAAGQAGAELAASHRGALTKTLAQLEPLLAAKQNG